MNTLLAITLQAALLAAIVFAIIKLAGRHIPPAWRAALWFLVIARLLIPIAPPSPLSLQNLFASAPAPAQQSTFGEGVPRVEVSEAIPSGNELIYTANITPAAPAPTPFPWQRLLFTLWATGAILSLTLLLTRALILRRRLRKNPTPPSSEILALLESCRKELRLHYPLCAIISADLAAPALTGLLPARLILPAQIQNPHSKIQNQELRHIFLHELAHIKLGHLFFHWLALLARCLHWFNPLVHVAATRLRHECELAADAMALARIAEPDRPAYGQTILDALARATTAHSPLSLAMAHETRHLEQRLQSLNNLATTRLQTLVGASVLVILTACGLTGPKQATAPTEQTHSPAVKTEEPQMSAKGPVGDPLLAANPNNRFLVSRQYRIADPAALVARVADQRGPKSHFPVQSHFSFVIHQDPGVQAERKADQIRHDDRALLFDEVTGILSARLTETELAVLEKELARLFAPASPTEVYSVIPNPIPAELFRPVGTVSGKAARMRVMTDETRLEAIVTLQLPLIDSSQFREPRTLKTLTWELTRIIRASDRRDKPVTLLMAPGSEDFLITIRNLEGRCSLREILHYIVAGAEAPAGAPPRARLQCSVVDNSVLFSVTSAADKVQTRFYQLPAGEDIPEDLKPFLMAITGGNTRTFFHNKIKGVLSVCAWEDHLDELQERIERRNNDAQPNSSKPADGEERRWNTHSKTNTVHLSEARKKLIEKLDTIHLEASDFSKSQTLADTLKDLYTKVRAEDPERRGVNFIIAPGRSNATPSNALERFIVKMPEDSGKISVRKLLDRIVLAAAAPPGSEVGYSIEDYAVVFSPRADPHQLYSRTFRLPANEPLPARLADLRLALGATNQVSGEGKAWFFNTRTGLLLVRATYPELDQIAEAVQGLPLMAPVVTRSIKLNGPSITNLSTSPDLDSLLRALDAKRRLETPYVHSDQTIVTNVDKSRRAGFAAMTNALARIQWTVDSRAQSLLIKGPESDLNAIERGLSLLDPPQMRQQVTFSAQILEMPVSIAQELLKDLQPSRPFASTNEVIVINDAGNKQVRDLTLSGSQNLLANVKDRVASTNINSPGQEYFVSPSLMKAILDNALKKGLELLSAPTVTTVVGRQARISIEESATVMTPKTFPQGTVVPFGPVVDVIATEFDGEKLAYDTTLTLTEFLGYAQSDNEKPLPRFRVRQLNAKTKVQPGLTHIFSATLPDVGISGQGAAIWNSNARVGFFMITPTLVDGVGNIAFPEKHAK